MTKNRSWVENFCSTPRGKYMLQIDQNFLQDQFNNYGLIKIISQFKEAYRLIKCDNLNEYVQDNPVTREIEESAILLYGLLHARYLLTESALKAMRAKYNNGDYECCPRTSCQGTRCLPYGFHDEPNQGFLRIFCPRCKEVYLPENDELTKIDGAFFGHSYLLSLLSKFPDLVKEPVKTELRLFGFKIDLENESESESESNNEDEGEDMNE